MISHLDQILFLHLEFVLEDLVVLVFVVAVVVLFVPLFLNEGYKKKKQRMLEIDFHLTPNYSHSLLRTFHKQTGSKWLFHDYFPA